MRPSQRIEGRKKQETKRKGPGERKEGKHKWVEERREGRSKVRVGAEAGNHSPEEARMLPQVRSWENRNARLRSSKATAPTTRGLAAP